MDNTKLTNKEKEELRTDYMTDIKDYFQQKGEDIDFAVKNAKTVVLNMPITKNGKEGWLEVSVVVKASDYTDDDGYGARETKLINDKVKAEEAKKKQKEKEKKMARDAERREQKRLEKERAKRTAEELGITTE